MSRPRPFSLAHRGTFTERTGSRRALAALADVVDAHGVRIVQGDFFDSSWAGYDVVFFFDQSSFAPGRVREKLRRELDPGAVLLVGHEQSSFPGLRLEAAFPDLETPHPVVKVYRLAAAQSEEPAERAQPAPDSAAADALGIN